MRAISISHEKDFKDFNTKSAHFGARVQREAEFVVSREILKAMSVEQISRLMDACDKALMRLLTGEPLSERFQIGDGRHRVRVNLTPEAAQQMADDGEYEFDWSAA